MPAAIEDELVLLDTVFFSTELDVDVEPSNTLCVFTAFIIIVFLQTGFLIMGPSLATGEILSNSFLKIL